MSRLVFQAELRQAVKEAGVIASILTLGTVMPGTKFVSFSGEPSLPLLMPLTWAVLVLVAYQQGYRVFLTWNDTWSFQLTLPRSLTSIWGSRVGGRLVGTLIGCLPLIFMGGETRHLLWSGLGTSIFSAPLFAFFLGQYFSVERLGRERVANAFSHLSLAVFILFFWMMVSENPAKLPWWSWGAAGTTAATAFASFCSRGFADPKLRGFSRLPMGATLGIILFVGIGWV